jgi:hypothetical protein
MKHLKKISFLLVMIIASVQAFSQLEVGAQLGIGASTQADLGNICKNDDVRYVVNAGILARYQTNDWLAVKSSLTYTQKGSQIDDSDETYRINYLQLPVKAEFSSVLKQGNASRIFFASGPYLTTRLKAEYEANKTSSDIKQEVNSTDIGWTFELGFQLPVASEKLLISLNYDMGFSEVFKTQDDIQNKTLSLNLGFLF